MDYSSKESQADQLGLCKAAQQDNMISIMLCQIYYRECKIRRNMLTANPMQEQLRCCQIWGRRRKREENHRSGPWSLWQLIPSSRINTIKCITTDRPNMVSFKLLYYILMPQFTHKICINFKKISIQSIKTIPALQRYYKHFFDG